MNARPITILPVLNGFIVSVGCQQVVFDSPAKLAFAINEYYSDPAKSEARYLKEAVNKTMDGPQPVCEAPIRPASLVREPRPYPTEECGQHSDVAKMANPVERR